MWHELPFHELIKLLNCLKEFSSLKWFGSSFHVLATKYLKVLIPYLVVLVDGILAVFLEKKLKMNISLLILMVI
jgi:hypothetical protein